MASRRTVLSVSADAKTRRGESLGVLTGIAYLSPHRVSGVNLCPMADLAGCSAPCLNTAGRGAFTITQQRRLSKTLWWLNDRGSFLGALRRDIRALVRKAERQRMVPMVRLNGVSDIRWEREAPELFEEFHDVQFYDYTKIPTRRDLPSNYHLTFSYSGANERYREFWRPALDSGLNIAVVFRRDLPDTFLGLPVVNGDESDVRPYDPSGVVVGLKAKGRAKRDTSGFVVDL